MFLFPIYQKHPPELFQTQCKNILQNVLKKYICPQINSIMTRYVI